MKKLLLIAALVGCGGGGSPQVINPIVGTPADTYTLTFTATSASATVNKTMILTVN